jgi:hypothetical protein
MSEGEKPIQRLEHAIQRESTFVSFSLLAQRDRLDSI